MNPSDWRRCVAFGLVLLLGTAGAVLAQGNVGNVYVEVTDTEGNPLPGVTVELSGFGAAKVQISTAQGEARFLALDPGDWSLKASLDGFSTVEYPRINVRITRNTTVQVQLSSAVEEVITVTSESPLLDERRITSGSTITQLELEKIPTARDPWSVLAQTPGVFVDRINVGGNESGQQAIFRGPGVSDDENAFLVDGVEITDMAAIGASSTYYDFDQFSEMQFTTGGTDVAKSSGGVSVNLVTKRGSNEFRGSARFNVTDSNAFLWLKQSTPDVDRNDLEAGQGEFVGNAINKIEEWGFEAGGPVIRDRVWFWGSHGQNDIKNLTGEARTSDDTILTNTAFKINAQFSGSNSALGSWNNGDKEKFGRNASPTRPPETTWNQRGPTAIIKFEDTHVFSSSFFLSGGYNKVDGGFSLFSLGFINQGGNDAPQAHRGPGRVWEGSFWNGGSSRPSDEFHVDGSYFFNTGNVSHELKFGARLREFDSQSTFGWSNNNAWSIDIGAGKNPALLITQRGFDPPTNQKYTSTWVQDTFSSGNLTVNAGFRYDLQEGTNDPITADANLWFPSIHPDLDFGGKGAPFEWETISPRIGITYALGEERKTLLRASFAQYPEQLQTGDISRVNPAGPSYITLLWYDTDGSGEFNGSVQEGNGPDDVVIIGVSGFDLADPTALISPNVTDPGLDPSIGRGVVLGIEHAFLPEFVVGLDLTYTRGEDIKEERSFIRLPDGSRRTATRADYVSDGFLTGTLPDGSAYSVPLWSLNPDFSYTGGELLLNGDRETEYQGVGLNFTKRLSNQWMARGYFQYGDAEWDIPASFFDNQSGNICEDSTTFGCEGATGGMIDNGLFAVQSAGSGAKADLWTQATWQFNVNGMYQVAPDRPWGFNVAANIFGREGYPLPYFEDIVTSDGQNRDILVIQDLDDFRSDDILTVDLRLDKEFVTAGNVTFTVGVEAFNLLNEAYVLQRERSLNRSSANFLRETLSPRVWRLGVRVNWR